MAGLPPVVLFSTMLFILRRDPYGECCIKKTTKPTQEGSCPSLKQPDDLASSFIKDIHSTVTQADCDLASPGDFPPPYYPDDGEEFDFIVIGSGSAGSVVANRLSEIKNWKILLIEAGGYPTKTTEVPALYGLLQNTSVDWSYQTEPDENNCLGMVNNRCNWPRGRVLGGSSSINANLYVRGNPKDYDTWAANGNTDWDYKSVLPYFMKSEDIKAEEVLNKANYKDYHGEKGYLPVNSYTDYGIEEFLKVYANGMKELGYDLNEDCNGESQLGLVSLQGTITDGKRCSVAKAFLKPIVGRSNLKVATNTLVTKILIKKQSKTAYGIKLFNNHGKEISIKAKKEVIVSAGAINTPQLLMLSGIGPKEHLVNMGIDVVQDLPVGENLQDHMLMVGLVLSHNFTRSLKTFPDYMYDFLRTNCSRFSGVGFLKYSSFINTKNNKINYPDIQVHHYQFDANDSFLLNATLKAFGIREDISKQYHDINSGRFITLPMLTLLRPKSRGKILLKSTNPKDKAKIISGYFSDDGEDLETYQRGIDFISKLAATDGMKAIDTKFHEIVAPACEKFPVSSKDFRICALKHFTATTYHPTSSCKMGPDNDPTAVVNPKLEVRGLKNLRVVDASVMSTIVSGNTNAPTIMIGEKASDIIKKTWLSS